MAKLKTVELAGSLSAGAVYDLSRASHATPTFAYNGDDGEWYEKPFVLDDVSAAIAQGREMFEDLPMDATDGVLCYDDEFAADGGLRSAILVELRTYRHRDGRVKLAIPFRRANSDQFSIAMPVIVESHRFRNFSMIEALEAFLRGVDRHYLGSRAWYAAFRRGRQNEE